MSFRIHPHTPSGGACMIQVKALHRAHSVALAQLHAQEEEEEYSDEEVEQKSQPVQPAQGAQAVPVAAQPAASGAQLHAPGPQSVEETFKLRRKRRV